jgi:RAB6A-GEF complex partner protein 1
MYWPIGTPRIYATTTAHPLSRSNSFVVSHDGLPAGSFADAASLSSLEPTVAKDREPNPDDPDALPLASGAPLTPATPYIRSIEHDTSKFGSAKTGIHYLGGSDPAVVPTGEPIVALKVSRTGHLFAVITASTLTIWQTKVGITILTARHLC